MAISRVTIGGFRQETGTTARVTIQGFRQETVAASGATSHAASGVLTSQSATISGTSANIKKHAASGVLTAQSATLAGTSANIAKHAASGVLVAQAATLSGTSAHIAKHAASGVLVAGSATIDGTGLSLVTHAATGSLVAGSATISSIGQNGTVVAQAPSGGFLDYGENARIKRRKNQEIEAREAVEKAQDFEIISVKPVSQIEPTNKKRQDGLDKAIALATQENSELRALNLERDAEIKTLLLVEQAIRNEDEEVLLLYAATLRQPMQIAA